jgi:hypothetical protein
MLRDAGNRYIRSVLSTLSMHSGWRDCNSLLGHATYASYATTFAQNAARKGQIRIRGDKKKCQPGFPALYRGGIRFDLHARCRVDFGLSIPLHQVPSGEANKGCIFAPDVYVSFLTTEGGIMYCMYVCHLHHSSWPRSGGGTSCSKLRLIMDSALRSGRIISTSLVRVYMLILPR